MMARPSGLFGQKIRRRRGETALMQKVRELIQNKGGLLQFLRYLVVGGSAVVVDFLLFELFLFLWRDAEAVTVLAWSFSPEKVANAIAVVGGFVYSFILNRNWSFHSKENALVQLLMLLVLLVINTWISGEVISFLGRREILPFGVAKLMMQVAIALWNYVIYAKLIYRR